MKDLFVWIDVFFGIRNMKTSRNLSALINLYLDSTEVDKFYIYHMGADFLILGDLCLWWSNFPYASCHVCAYPVYEQSRDRDFHTKRGLNRILVHKFGYSKCMPDRKTMWRLYKISKSLSRRRV